MSLLDVRDEGLESCCHLGTSQRCPDMNISAKLFFFFFNRQSSLKENMQFSWQGLADACMPFHFEKRKRNRLIKIFSFSKYPPVRPKAVHHDGDMRTNGFILTLWHSSCFRKMNGRLSSEHFPVYDLHVFFFMGKVCFFFFFTSTSLILLFSNSHY